MDDHARRTKAGMALHDRLIAALKERRPEALEAAELLLSAEDARRGPRGALLKRLVAPEEPPSSFSFGFAGT